MPAGYRAGFLRDAATDTVQVTTVTAGATWQSGFLRAPTGELVVTTSPVSPSWQGGFLRDGNGAVVINVGGQGTVSGGWVRDSAGALVVGTLVASTAGGFARDVSGAPVMTGFDTPSDPNWSQTVLHLGDIHVGATTQTRLDTTQAALQALPGTPALTLQIGDMTEPPAGGRDATAVTFVNSLPGTAKRFVVGNHDLNGTRDGDAAATAYAGVGGTGRNWVLDLGFAYCVAVGPLTWAPGDPFLLDQIALDFLESSLAGAPAGKPCLVFEHAPMQNTVGVPPDDPTWYSSADPQMYVTPNATVRSTLGAHANAKVFINGHTHTPQRAPGFTMDVAVGSRTIHQINSSGIKGQHNPARATDALIAVFTTVIATGLEVRVYDLSSRQWSLWPEGKYVRTHTFPSRVLPSSTALPVVSGAAVVGQTLTATQGSWTGGDQTFAYQWRRDGVDIAAATAATYVLQAADQGTTITVRVSATNDAGTGSATSAGVGPIAPAAGPQFLNEPFTAADATLVQSLTNWVKHPVQAIDAVVTSNRARSNAAGSPLYYYSVVPGSADYSVSATLWIQDNNSSTGGPVARLDTAALTCYWARYDTSANASQLFKFVAGASTQLGANNAVARTTGDILTVECIVDQISLKVNGTTVIGPITDAAVAGPGRAGMRFTGTPGAAAGVQIDTLTATT